MKKHILRCLFIATCPVIFILLLWCISFGAFDLMKQLREPGMIAVDSLCIVFALIVICIDHKNFE